MSFFTPDFEKPGPGISKDAPPKKGIALFFEILVREFWQLIKLNLIFILACIPIVTIGAAVSGLSKSTTKMVRDVPNDVWDDFKDGFKENLRQTFLPGIIVLLLFVGSFLGLILYREQPFLQTASLIVLLLMTSISIHFLPMFTSTTVSARESVRNACLLSILRFYLTIPTALFCIFYIEAQLLLLPFSIPFTIFLGFSIPSFVASFTAWGGIRRHIIRDDLKTNDSE